MPNYPSRTRYAARVLSKIIALVFPFAIFAIAKLDLPSSWNIMLLGVAAALMLNLSDRTLLVFQVAIVIGSCAVLLAFKPENLPRLYPFALSASFLAFFFLERRADPPLLERLSPSFIRVSPAKRELLRMAANIWIGGLLINTLVLGLMMFAFPIEYWLYYSGFISYMLLLLMLLMTIGYVGWTSRSIAAADDN